MDRRRAPSRSSTSSLHPALGVGYALARPLLFRLDPETAHALTLAMLRAAGQVPALFELLRWTVGADDPALAIRAFGLRFPNPIGLAAGLDKNAHALPAWAGLGFGHVEVGTVTPQRQPGNPRPRIFRVPSHGALINRMGFPNDGATAVARRLAARRLGRMVVGGNVGKGIATPLERAIDDYEQAARVVGPHVDYLTVNVSSPNTPGLRQLQAPEQTAAILTRVHAVTPVPVLLKLAPDLALEELPEIVAAAREAGVAGFVATNTTSSRAGLEGLAIASEAGGLSGTPLRARAIEVTARLVDLAGPDLPVVAVGGVESADDVRARLALGARLVQIYTGLIYRGPTLVADVLRALRTSR